MKRWIASVGWMVFWVATLLHGDLVMVQKMEEGGPNKKSSEITLKIKGDKIRADISPEISVLMDTASGETVTLHHGQKTLLKIDADAAVQIQKGIGQLREKRKAEGAGDEAPKIESTGKHDTISGQETTIYTARAGEIKMTWWIAQKMPDAEKFLSALALLQKTSMAKLASGMTLLPEDWKFPGVPLKTEIAMPDGRKITITIVSLKEMPLEEMDFSIPPDYHCLPEPQFAP